MFTLVTNYTVKPLFFLILTQFVVFWAQRSNANVPEKNVLYVTIAAEDIENPQLDLTPTSFHFYGTSTEGQKYDLKVNLFEEIDPKESKFKHTDRHTVAVLRKAKAQEEYWPRLTKEKGKVFYIRTDFDKWVDEDEQDEPQGDDPMGMDDLSSFGGMEGLGGMPGMPGMGGMGGMPGMGGMGGMPGLEGLGGMPGMEGLAGLGGGSTQEQLLESLRQDAAAQGKSLDDFAKQYNPKPSADDDGVTMTTGHLGDEEDAEEAKTEKA